MTSRPCPCGSGEPSRWQFDARGIELCRTCDTCHDEKMARYRPDVLTDSNYWSDEPIEGDETPRFRPMVEEFLDMVMPTLNHDKGDK